MRWRSAADREIVMRTCVASNHRSLAVLLLIAALFANTAALAADVYDSAVAHPGRSADDLKRDPVDRPADVLRAAAIKPGMRVADFFAADGYYSELLSYIVGPKGHVLLINNPPYDKFANNAWKERIGKRHLKNVEHLTVDPAHMGLKDSSLDAIIMIKVYHDLYWVDPANGWPKIDVPSVLDQLARALKPGGALLVVDHSAKAGSGSNDAGSLHRIDEEFMRKDFQSHGFKFVSKSDFLRRPDDKRDQISYKPPIVGQTDRFVYVFRKDS
jgi:predicted methyltransferase